MDKLSLKQTQILAAIEDERRRGGLLVRDVMTIAPSHVPPTTTALELIELFHAKRFRHLLVTCPDKGLIGIISDRDVVRCLGPDESPRKERLAATAASDIMSTDLITIGPNAPLERAVRIIVEQGISCLPVMADGTLVGILTNTDLQMVLQTLLQTISRASSAESPAEPVVGCSN